MFVSQTLWSDSRPGELYVVDSESLTPEVPYGNSFYLVSRFCMSRVNSRQTRVQINSIIKYRTKLLGFIKGKLNLLK